MASHPFPHLAFFWAELDAIDLVMDYEERFGVMLCDDDLSGTPWSVRGLTELVMQKRANSDCSAAGR